MRMASLNAEFKRLYRSRELSAYDSLPPGLMTGGYESKERPTISKTLGLRSDVCATCKKRFEHTSEHAYRRNKDNRCLIFCSYSCMRQYDAAAKSNKNLHVHHTGRKKKRLSERIADLEEKIALEDAALATGIGGEERIKLKKRRDRHIRELRKARGIEEKQDEPKSADEAKNL